MKYNFFAVHTITVYLYLSVLINNYRVNVPMKTQLKSLF